MNVWIRISSHVETASYSESGVELNIRSGMIIAIHRSEQFARVAAEKFGGIVLEVNAASLRGYSESYDGIINIEESDRAYDRSGQQSPSTVYLKVICDEVPHRKIWRPLYHHGEAVYALPPGASERQYWRSMEFLPEGEAYLDALTVETGANCAVL